MRGRFSFPFRNGALLFRRPVRPADFSSRDIDPSPSDFRLADGVLVINLDRRPERLAAFAATAAQQPALRGWQRLAAVNGVDLPGFGKAPWFRQRNRDKCWAGRAGCVLSHRKALLHARDAGWERVLILEDDARFAADFAAGLGVLNRRLGDPQLAWEVCYLGFTQPLGPCLKVAELGDQRALYQLHGCATTHAYLVKREAYPWLIDQLPEERTIWAWVARHRAIDRWYARHLSGRFTVVAVAPSLCGQDSDFSDIGQRDAGNTRAAEFYAGFPAAMVVRSSGRFGARRLQRRTGVALEGWFDALRAIRKRWRGL